MRATRLRAEYLHEPLGLGVAAPHLSWTCADGVRQTGYRIVATRDGATVWDTGRVASDAMTHHAYAGEPLRSRDHVSWTVQLWDENDRPGEPARSHFELGLLQPADWTAGWITAGRDPARNRRGGIDHFRHRFAARGPVASARLYATAAGVYRARINGRDVGEWCLAPGSTDYRHRLQYQTFDVTDLVADANELTLELADGWWRGSVGCFGQTHVFGERTAALAQLELRYADGTHETIATGPGWEWSQDGPVRFADLKDGEVVDFRLSPSYDGRARALPAADTAALPAPTASDNVPVTRHETFTATEIRTPSGARVLDFGQNIAGFVRFAVAGRPGQRVRLLLGETLDAAGEFTQDNFTRLKPTRRYGRASEVLLMLDKAELIPGELQPTPRQEILVTCSGATDRYETAFSVFGFRYALLETDVEVDAAAFEAVAVYSALETTGSFTCSHPEVDAFLANTRWSMKGNFLDVPTDCPTRERMGWTGDAQVFFDTGAYLADVAPFFRKYLRDLADAQHRDGWVSAVVPYSGLPMMYDNSGKSVGWADALVLLPYRFWRRYGDRDLLAQCYPMMRAYGSFMISHTGRKDRRAAADPLDRYVYEKGFHLGEWLEPLEFRDDVRDRRLLRTEEATAYLHYTMRHLAEAATELGHEEDAARWREYADGARLAYRRMFVADGGIDTDRQAKLVRPLALGLLDADEAARVADRLVTAVERADHTVGTGFLSTPFLLRVLTDAGRADVAYRMLENTRAPGWLAQVRAGATTVWEDWEGTESLNHYSPGSVCAWLFDTVAGITVTGANRFGIAPVPGGSLTHAAAGYDSPYGTVASAWRRTDAGWEFDIDVPPNTSADVTLPDGSVRTAPPGHHRYRVAVGDLPDHDDTTR